MARASRLVCRLLLGFYPTSYRARWRNELEHAMLVCIARERDRIGLPGAVYAWVRLALDALSAGMMIRLEELRQKRMRDEFRPGLFDDVFRDVRHGMRTLYRAPGLTLVCSVTLALSIGAATTVFSVVNGVLIKPLPYGDAAALISIWNGSQTPDSRAEVPNSATQFFTYRDENRVFAAFGLWSSGMATVTGRAEPEEVQTLRVTYGTLQTLGVAPAIGRWFSQHDDTPGSEESVILTRAYWRRQFGDDLSIIGRTLIVDSLPRTVIGIMPGSFRFLNETPDVILPLRFDRSSLLLGSFNYSAVARLKPDVTMEQASADVARMNQIWLNAWPSPPGFNKQRFAAAPTLRPLKHDVVGDTGNLLWVLMGTIGLVLLIACANVANLLLLRAEERRKELAIRAALGAASHRIARQLLVESLLLGLLGGGLGVGVTFIAVRLLIASDFANLPRLDDITIDPLVLSFALLVSILSSVLFGLIPIVRYVRPHIVPLLRVGERTSSGSRDQHRTRNTLVVVQVSLALVLLLGSGLMIRTFLALRAVHPGFTDADQIQLVRFTLPRTLVEDPERVFRMQSDILDRIAAIPGVAAASLASAAPMEPFVSANTVLSEHQPQSEGTTRRFKFVSPRYFETVGTPVVAGRDFEWSDVSRRRPVAVISENLAREMWRNAAAAVGKRIRENPEGPWREIIGVVGDVFDDGVHAPAPMIAYWPALMENFEGERIRVRRGMSLVIRSSRTGSDGFLKDIQQGVWAVNASLPLARVQTLDAIYERSLARTSFTLVMLVIAASMALLLGLVGIYGVIAYTVTQRTREIGIRIALGAQPGELRRMFLRQGLVLGLTGVVSGVAIAVAVTRLMSSLLFGITPLDPATYFVACAVLILAAAVASDIPARKALTVDPVKALRAQ
jgi:putative ABC transport system permease protein